MRRGDGREDIRQGRRGELRRADDMPVYIEGRAKLGSAFLAEEGPSSDVNHALAPSSYAPKRETKASTRCTNAAL